MLDGRADHRTWGDGATDRRVHVIEDISYTEGFIACRCGTFLVGEGLPMERAWEHHLGSDVAHREVRRAYATADDGEVADFLERLSDPHAHRQPAGGLSTVGDDADWEVVATLLEAYETLRATCTCDRTPVMLCPNYVEGDEDE